MESVAQFRRILFYHCERTPRQQYPKAPLLTVARLLERGDRYHDVREQYTAGVRIFSLPLSSLFAYGLKTGGPGVMTIGWIIVSMFSMMVVPPCLPFN